MPSTRIGAESGVLRPSIAFVACALPAACGGGGMSAYRTCGSASGGSGAMGGAGGGGYGASPAPMPNPQPVPNPPAMSNPTPAPQASAISMKVLVSDDAVSAPATDANLKNPWGIVFAPIALAPANWGTLSNGLLIGNFGDALTNGFDPNSGTVLGTVSDANGQPIANMGFWGIAFGNGSNDQPTTTLHFAAGIAAGDGGVYGRIDLAATQP